MGLRAGVVGAEYGLLVDLLLEAEAEADVLRTAPAIVGVGEDQAAAGTAVLCAAAVEVVQVVCIVGGVVVVAGGVEWIDTGAGHIPRGDRGKGIAGPWGYHGDV